MLVEQPDKPIGVFRRVSASEPFALVVVFLMMISGFSTWMLFSRAPKVEATLDTPMLITYQGKLTDASRITVPDSALNMKFAIYTSASGASGCVWSAGDDSGDGADTVFSQSSDCPSHVPSTAVSVTPSEGVVTVILGASPQNAIPDALFDDNSALYLGVTVGADSEMTPRIRLTATPYAFQAGDADLLDGLDSTAFLTSSTAFVQGGNSFAAAGVIGTNDAFALSFETNGTTQMSLDTSGHLTPAANDTQNLGSDSLRWADLYLGPGTLHVGTVATDEGIISYDTTGNVLNFGTDSTTNGDIAFFTDDLYIDKSASSVGIGDTTPDYLLDVAGTFGTDGNVTLGDASGDTVTSNAAAWTFANATTVALASSTAALNFDSNTLVIDSTNNRVGIGTAAPNQALAVTGSADVTGHSAIGANATVDDGTLMWPTNTFSNVLTVAETSTNVSVDFVEGISSYLNYNPSGSATTVRAYAVDGEVASDAGNSQNIDAMVGGYLSADHNGTGTVTELNGIEVSAERWAGTVTNAYGVNAYAFDGVNTYGVSALGWKQDVTAAGNNYGGHFEAYSSNVVTTGTDNTYGVFSSLTRTGATGGTINTYGYYLDVAALDAAGAGTSSAYGLYLENVTGADTNYALYSAGGQSYFAGNVGIADATPDFTLDVAGTLGTDGNATIGDATTDRLTVTGELLLGSISADPTGANGLTYYNTTTNKFRCYENGAWANCIGAGGGGVDNFDDVYAESITDGNLTMEIDDVGGLNFDAISGNFVLRDSGSVAFATFTTGGVVNFANDVDLGSSTADTISMNGYLDTGLVPTTDGTLDLGSTSNRWGDLYLDGATLHVGDAADDEFTLSYNAGTNLTSLNSDGTAGEIAFLSADTERMRIDENGYVGIGIANPTAPLTVVGGMDVNLSADDNVVIDGSTNQRTITLGVMRFLHTPAIQGTRAISLFLDANNQSDTSGIVVDYDASNFDDGQTGYALKLAVDGTSGTGGEVRGLDVTALAGSTADIVGLHAGVGVDPVHSFSGAFGNVDTAFIDAGGFTTVTSSFNSTGTDVQMFVANGDVVYVGADTTFGAISFALATAASGAGIKPTFEFSNGAGWTAFGPNDATNGMRVSGSVSWDAADIPTWATQSVNATTKYWVRITRTQTTLATPPTEDLVQYAATTEYKWDANGDLAIRDIAVNGGDITTSAATFNLAASATTLNMVGGSGSTGCSIDGSGNLACSGSVSGTGGAGGWTDGGTDVTLTTSTDNVGIGGASLAKLSVDGDANEIQFLVQGNSTQSSDLLVAESSAGADYFAVQGDGDVVVDTSTLFVDASNNRVTIGSTTANTGNPFMVSKSDSGTSIDSVNAWASLHNSNTTNNSLSILSFATNDTGGTLAGGARMAAQFTSHAIGGVSADFIFQNRSAGAWIEPFVIRSTGNIELDGTTFRLDAAGNSVGIGDTTPDYKLDVAGTFGTDGDVTLGDAATDNVVFNADVNSNVLPNTDDTYTLGSTSQRWADLFLGPSTLYIGTSATDEGTVSYNTTTNVLGFGTDATTNGDIAFFTDDLYLDKSSGYVGIGDATPDHMVDIEAGTLASTVSALSLTGTLSSSAGNQFGLQGVFTSAGTASGLRTAMYMGLASGYTGSDGTLGFYAYTSAAGTGTNPLSNIANVGGTGVAIGVGTGTNVGIRAYADGSTGRNYGSYDVAWGTSAAANIGTFGLARNTGTTYNGGVFALGDSTTYSDAGFSFQNAALLADNRDVAAPVLVARDNGTAVFTIADGGATTLTSSLSVEGNTTLGNASGDTVTSNAAAWTFASDTAVTLSGGVNGLSFDGTTFSVDATNNRIGIGDASPEHALDIEAGSLADGVSALSATATLNAAAAATQFGTYSSFTANSGSSGSRVGQYTYLTGTYAGNSSTAVSAYNDTVGVGTTVLDANGNYGVVGYARGATAGSNVGFFAEAGNSTGYNFGGVGTAVISTAGSNVGIWGAAVNGGAGPQVGGLFTIRSTSGAATPTVTDAALIADNESVAAPILIARDNGTAVFTIADGGAVTTTGDVNIKSVSYTWPSSNASGVLTNNGSGTLSWSSAGTGTITAVGDVTSGAAFDGTQGNSLQFEGSSADGFETTLTAANPGADYTITLQAGTGTLAFTSDIPAAGANTTLSNLGSTAINTSLISDTDNTDDLGSASIRWRDLYLGPASLNIYSTTTTAGGGTNDVLGTLGFAGATGTAALELVTTNNGTATGGAINLTSARPSGGTTSSAFNLTTSTDLGATDELLQVGDSAGTFMTFLGNGSVGVGDISPDATLDVDGSFGVLSTTTTGTAASVTANSLTSGTGLSVTSTATGTTGNMLLVQSASTAAVSAGLARFNFTGNRTSGSGLLVDDADPDGSAFRVNSGVTTGTAQYLVTDSLTSGTGFDMEVGSTAMSGTMMNLLLYGSNAANTGTVLSANSTGSLSTAQALSAGCASTGFLEFGCVEFNFSGAHTGTGFLLTDGTTTGAAMAIAAGGLTSGKGLNISSASSTFTGSLLYVNNSSASSSGTTAMVTNDGTGTSLRVNDDGTDTDTSPFIIDASGNVGIGTTSANATLDVLGTGMFTIGASSTGGSVGDVQIVPVGSSPTSGRITFGTDGTGWDFRIAKNTAGTITDIMTFDDSGSVGIREPAPAHSLSVNNPASASATLGLTNSGSGNALTDGLLLEIDSALDTYIWNRENGDMYLGTNNATRMTIDAAGFVGIGVTVPLEELDVKGQIQFDIATIGDTLIGVCKNLADGNVDVEFTECSGTPGDVAEWYETTGAETAGDLVAVGSSTLAYAEELYDPATGLPTGSSANYEAATVERTTAPYAGKLFGIVSTSPLQVMGEAVNDAATNPKPIAISGRVPAKVNVENGTIAAGDPITSSSTAGVGMRATQPGMIVGYALDDWAGPGQGTIMVFVSPGFHMGEAIAQGPTGDATSGTPGMDSFGLSLRGSGWDGAAAQATAMKLVTDVTDATTYKLSVRNQADTEVAYITDDGVMSVASDMVVGGKLYPSALGVAQTNAYIYYGGAGDDFMRTNATGWGTGSYDFAEMFPSSQPLEPGEVVAFDMTSEFVKRAGGDDGMRLAGIVSTRPGFLAGTKEANTYPVALAGRVPTNVSVENGPVEVGDALTVSALRPGYAMKATEAGMIVGYALEPAAEDGSVIAFVHLGYWPGMGSQPNAGTENGASTFAGELTTLTMNGNIYMQGNQVLNVGALAGLGGIWSVNADGDFATEGSYKVVIESYQAEKVETVAPVGLEHKVTLSGTGTLTSGTATIAFEDVSPSFNDITSTTAPVRVLVTLRGAANGIFVESADHNGFVARETMGGVSDGVEFDWFVEAYRKDFEPAVGSGQEAVGEEPPAEEPPAEVPPVEPPPAEVPPAEVPPVEPPPAEPPPAEVPPAEVPPAEVPPAEPAP